jgi:threonine/homoserine/homoserine lactone efflux protein
MTRSQKIGLGLAVGGVVTMLICTISIALVSYSASRAFVSGVALGGVVVCFVAVPLMRRGNQLNDKNWKSNP